MRKYFQFVAWLVVTMLGACSGGTESKEAAMVLTLIGLEVLSYLFKSIGMKSSMITFSTDNKQVLKGVADRFNSKDYLIVSYQMDTQKHGSIETYQVTMIIKSKRNNDEGHLLSLIQEFPEVTVERIE